MRCGSVAVSASLMQRGALAVGGQHEVDQRIRPARRFLFHPAHAHAARQGDLPILGVQFAADQPEQRGLAGAVAADKADARPLGQVTEALSNRIRSPRRKVRSVMRSIPRF
jgi:hypothetical protein